MLKSPRVTNLRLRTALAQRLRARREFLGLSQTEIGARVGISFQQLQKYEHGKSHVGVETLFALAPALDTTPEALLQGIDGPGELLIDPPIAVLGTRRLAIQLAALSPRHRAAIAGLIRVLSPPSLSLVSDDDEDANPDQGAA